MAPFFFFGGWVSRARPAPTAGAGFFGRSGSWSRWWWVRLLVVGGRSGRWSVRGGVPTLERGNDQHEQTISMAGTAHHGWAGRGAKGAAGWGRAGAGCWANRNGPAAKAAGPGGTLASGGVIRPGFCGDGPRRPDRPDRCRRAAWWRVRGQAERPLQQL